MSAEANDEVQAAPGATIAENLTRCDQGEAVACSAVVEAYTSGAYDSSDEATGMRVVEHACASGASSACSQMGMLYAGNVLHDLSRADTALSLLDESCAKGNATACSWAGSLLEHGVETTTSAGKAVAIVPEDGKSALAFYTKACAMGSGIGCDYLGEVVRNDGDIRTFIKIEDKACVLDAALCGPIGERYVEGVVRPKDSERAAKFFKQGCADGGARACEGLARFTERGLGGIKKDKRAAKRLYQRACEAAPDLEEACEKAR